MVLIRKKKKKTAEELAAEKTEKDLRKAGIQDEFQAKGFELVDFVQHHKQYIIFGLLGCALLLVALGAFSHFSGGAGLKASADFEAATALYDKAMAAKDDKAKLQGQALDAFQKLAKANASSGVSRLAMLYVGHLSLLKGETKNAISAYSEFVTKASSKDQMRTVGVVGLASAYEANAEPKKALESYESLLASGVNVDEAMVLWQAARLARETGQEEKAKEFAAKLATTYPSSDFARQSQLSPSTIEE